MSSLFRKKQVSKLLEDAEKGFSEGEDSRGLNKVLGVKDLTALGVAATIGAGVFSTIGKACFDGGPGVVYLFIIIAVTCGFSALCYAEFASRIPVSGSAYTYSYASFGELIAWIIGWDLIMEYAVGNITVAISWSGNLTTFLDGMGLHIPSFLTKSFLEIRNGHVQFQELVAAHKLIPTDVLSMENLWNNAPHIGSMPLIFNFPALIITVLITMLVYVGIKESRNTGNLMVIFKVCVILLVIAIGIFHVNPVNWHPFTPNGMTGVLKGTSAVFFAYIGFDAISTTAEECRNPQRDLPRGMIYSLIISTLIYIAVALVLTGMVKYTDLGGEAFMANAFTKIGLNWIGGLIALSAVIATASVLLVFQIGQPRIWMSMSRDGLLPKKFSTIHPKYKTPSFSTVVTGFAVGIPSLILDQNLVTDLCSIGTLFAFILVCGGIMILQGNDRIDAGSIRPKFKVPYLNAQFIFPVFLGLVILFFYKTYPDELRSFYSFDGGWAEIQHRIPNYIFIILCVVLCLNGFRKKYSLIPVLGLVSCGYLMTTLGTMNWLRFVIWLIIGLVIYFSYGRYKSKLAPGNQ
ncbi:MAG TPA: amino acid permease [Ferruginibacter sp.]|nr:amino acid permease [Ferruginibacter sp.]